TPKRSRSEIAIHIHTTQGGQLLSAINVAARDAHAGTVVGEFAFRRERRIMRIFNDWVYRRAARLLSRFEIMESLAHAPAVIAPFDDEINFLPFVLADIARPKLARVAVEAHAPNIAQAVGPDFRSHAFRFRAARVGLGH